MGSANTAADKPKLRVAPRAAAVADFSTLCPARFLIVKIIIHSSVDFNNLLFE
jgi:hypothetical protein